MLQGQDPEQPVQYRASLSTLGKPDRRQVSKKATQPNRLQLAGQSRMQLGLFTFNHPCDQHRFLAAAPHVRSR